MRNKTQLLENELDMEVDFDFDNEGVVLNSVRVYFGGKNAIEVLPMLSDATQKRIVDQLDLDEREEENE